MKLQVLLFSIMSSGFHSWGKGTKMYLKYCARSLGILVQREEAETK